MGSIQDVRLHRTIRRHQRRIPNIKKGEPVVTRIFKTTRGRLNAKALAECVRTVEEGGLLILPTDTVYGVVCNAFRPEAVAAIYALKGRSYSKPLPIFIGNLQQL